MPVSRLVIALSVLVLVVAACTGGGASSPSPQASASDTPTGAPGGTAGDFDRAFIDMMVPHHQAAVAMAELAQERAERPELKELADEIITGQEGEIEQLRDWRETWFGSSDTPPMEAMPMVPGMEMEGHSMGGGMTVDMTEDIKALEGADDFDRAFIEAMIPHHESAIEAAKLARAQAGSPEARELAGEIIEAQESEIAQMREWLEAWY